MLLQTSDTLGPRAQLQRRQMSTANLKNHSCSWSGEEDVASNSPCSDQMQNSPSTSQSSTKCEGHLDNTCNPKTQHGRRKMKRRRKRMLTGVSRQRRAANERERRRIQGVNRAFVELKNALPLGKSVDISKIDILRVATTWIDHLTKLLDQDKKFCLAKLPECPLPDEPRLYEILGEEFSIIDHELEDDSFLLGQGRSFHINILVLFKSFVLQLRKGYKLCISILQFAAKQKLSQVSERCSLFGKFSRKAVFSQKN